MNAPALFVADGAPGLWKAARELWPRADEQRCTVHALRNVSAKLPERHHREVKARWWKTFDEAASPAEARRALEAIACNYRAAYPSAMAVIERDLDALVSHLRWPPEHRKRIRSTNLLERSFVEVRRRAKVIGRFPGETSALSLIWAVLKALQPRLARRCHDAQDRRRDRTTAPQPATRGGHGRKGVGRRLGSATGGATPERISPGSWDATIQSARQARSRPVHE